MANSPNNTISPLHHTAPHLSEAGADMDNAVGDGAPAPNVYAFPARDLGAAVDHALRRAPGAFARGAAPAAPTPARDAYLDARAQAGAVGIALADPRMRRALILARLEHDRTRIASSLPEGYDATAKPSALRRRERADWERHRGTVRALDANAEWQEHLRTELGPNSEQMTRRAVALAEAREAILARTPELQRNAIEEEIAP